MSDPQKITDDQFFQVTTFIREAFPDGWQSQAIEELVNIVQVQRDQIELLEKKLDKLNESINH